MKMNFMDNINLNNNTIIKNHIKTKIQIIQMHREIYFNIFNNNINKAIRIKIDNNNKII